MVFSDRDVALEQSHDTRVAPFGGQLLRAVVRRARDDKGVALVEFALVLPLLLLLLIGMLDVGKAMNTWIDETHLATTGARWAAVNQNPGSGTLQAFIKSQADTSELRSDARVCISFSDDAAPFTGTAGVGDSVEVQVLFDYNWLPFLTNQLGSPATTTVGGSAKMRLEAAPTNYSAGSGGTGTCV